jgi:hypothetical protein
MRNLNQLEVRTLREGVIPKPRVFSSGARDLAYSSSCVAIEKLFSF